jgi:hypothetical protein
VVQQGASHVIDHLHRAAEEPLVDGLLGHELLQERAQLGTIDATREELYVLRLT